MNVFIVPCTQGKTWDREPARGATPAKDAYTDPCFLKWRQHVEATGEPWYVLSTKHGLLAPDDRVPGPYDVPLAAISGDAALMRRLGEQGRRIDFSRFERVILLDWKRFEPLVRAAVGNTASCMLRPLVFDPESQ